MSIFAGLGGAEIAQGGVFEPLAPGEYQVKVDQIEATLSKAGKPMFVIDFIVTEGDQAGKSVRTWMVFQMPKGINRDVDKMLSTVCPKLWSADPKKREKLLSEDTWPDRVINAVTGAPATILVKAGTYKRINNDGEEENVPKANVSRIDWMKPKTKKSKIKIDL